MAYTVDRIFPTENDVGGTDKGRVFRETINRDLLWTAFAAGGPRLGGTNFVKTGLTYSSASGLSATFAAGEAIIDGCFVKVTGTEDATLVDNTTNHVWLRMTEDGNGLVDDAELHVTTDSTIPDRAVYLRFITTASGVVTSQTDGRPLSPLGFRGANSANGSAISVRCGFKPILLVIVQDDPDDGDALYVGLPGGFAWSSANWGPAITFHALGFDQALWAGDTNTNSQYEYFAFAGEQL